MPLFDAYIMVDWSAAAKPVTGPNTIWVGILAKDARLKHQFRAVNIETRLKAREFLRDMCKKLSGRGDRILLGFDFSLGYPAGTAKAIGLDLDAHAPWQAMHAHLAGKVKEKPDNSNARFAIAASMNYAISKGPFPFWGAPKRDQVSTLAGTKPDFDGAVLAEFRQTEQHMKASIAASPKSCWQLAYSGSVGSQSLLGIPHVHALRHELEGARLWPFETGFSALSEDALSDTKVLMCEVYPSQLTITPQNGEILDAAQVRQMASHYCDLDKKDRLSGVFDTPESLETGKITEILAEEGWILPILPVFTGKLAYSG